jgi:hypothetical protein
VKKAVGLAIALCLAACSGPRYPTTAPEAGAPPSPSPPALAAKPPRSPIPRPRVQVRDQCGAAELQSLIGRLRTEAPVPIDPNRQRVACTTCPAAEDFDPARLSILFDADTGVIRQVRCG